MVLGLKSVKIASYCDFTFCITYSLQIWKKHVKDPKKM